MEDKCEKWLDHDSLYKYILLRTKSIVLQETKICHKRVFEARQKQRPVIRLNRLVKMAFVFSHQHFQNWQFVHSTERSEAKQVSGAEYHIIADITI